MMTDKFPVKLGARIIIRLINEKGQPDIQIAPGILVGWDIAVYPGGEKLTLDVRLALPEELIKNADPESGTITGKDKEP